MSSHETLVPIVFFLSIAGVLGYMIMARHKERMGIIEKGLKAEDMKALYERSASRQLHPLSSLKWGVIFVCLGLAVLIGMYLHATYNVEGAVFPGLMAIFGGVGLILFYLIAHKKVSQ